MEMIVTGSVTCSNPLCRVAADGKCVEGLELTQCGQYGRLPGLAEAPSSTSPLKPVIELGGAQLLTSAQLGHLLRARISQVVAIVGPTGSGKTSLIAAVYDLLQLSRLGGSTFVTSSTLHAFELACHDARAQSNREIPHTGRTARGEVRYYHLDVIGGPFATRTTLLLADRAGEEYEMACDDSARLDEFPELPRADCLMVLVDGKKFADTKERHVAVDSVTLMLQGLSERTDLMARKRIALVLTKWDEVLSNGDQDSCKQSFDRLLRHMQGLFATTMSLEGFIVAASPHHGEVELGHGIAELAQFWSRRPVGQAAAFSHQTPERMFDRYGASTGGAL